MGFWGWNQLRIWIEILLPVHSTLVRFPRHSIEIKSIAELPGAVGRIENPEKRNRTPGVLNGGAEFVIAENRGARGSSQNTMTLG